MQSAQEPNTNEPDIVSGGETVYRGVDVREISEHKTLALLTALVS